MESDNRSSRENNLKEHNFSQELENAISLIFDVKVACFYFIYNRLLISVLEDVTIFNGKNDKGHSKQKHWFPISCEKCYQDVFIYLF